MCVRMLIHIPRHMGRMSNNNNKIIGLTIYELFILCRFYALGNSGCVNSKYGDMRYGVYMRVSLFRLFFRRINLVNP